ncbi:hypothetical protein G7Y89_g10398 [Cudoniella acicularis]|uniref:Cas1 appressorium specific protein n=1 Tax=Cudoniella acicularis TaxID=354080 RepID=A0A8H4RFK8_9HELO|nr:hypothetical protein G7Y89_g10398 [Cudoniella acicularis]
MLAPSASIFLAALLATPFAAAHGKIAVVTGDFGGNGTALGIKGAVVPGAGSNSKTETDTTTFNVGSNNCGETEAATGVKVAMALSGSTLPQISTDNASISGTFHIVTSDGAGPVIAMVDTTGQGNFANAAKATVTTQVPGTKGNIKKTTKRWEDLMIRAGLMKRATNINEDYPFAVAIPAGITCTGTVAGQTNVCMVKISNNNAAGPFGGCVVVQQSGTNSTIAAKRTISQPLKV